MPFYKLYKLKQLQKDFIRSRDSSSTDEDEYIFFDNHIIELQSLIDSAQKECNEFASLIFLTLGIILGFVSLFYYPLTFISILCRMIGITYVIYIISHR